VVDLVALILKTMKSKLRPLLKNEASNEIAQQWLSSKKAREKLGWKPAYDLSRGLAETVAWYRKHLS
jgi:nucleoside-diphosphate-sugar epimerase